MTVKFWRKAKPDATSQLAEMVNVVTRQRTKLLVELAGERRRLEARLVEVAVAEVALLTGQLVQPAPEQPARPIGDAPWFPTDEEFQPEPEASIFAAEAVAEVREPETATASTGARQPVEEETEAPAEAENGKPPRMAEEERARFANYLAARSMNVPVPPR
jgi:hypothetical protein